DDDAVEACVAAGLVEERDLGDGDVSRLFREPRTGGRANPRVELGLEPGELGAVGEDDPADLLPIDLAAPEDPLAPPLPQSRLQPLVLAVKTVDDVVAGDHGGTVACERLERLALAGCDAARERDRERPLHDYSAGASSEASASAST